MAIIKTKEDSLNIRLGSGLSMPLNGSFIPVSGVDMLLQDIQQLLLTVPGERVFRPDFGCNLRNMVWENIDTLIQIGPTEIRNALSKFESRITVTSIQSSINRNTGLVLFSIVFLINATSTSARSSIY